MWASNSSNPPTTNKDFHDACFGLDQFDGEASRTQGNTCVYWVATNGIMKDRKN